MMERGVRVGMGTDGLWSSPSMNLFEETLFAVELHGLDGAQGLELATIGGARALGIGAETGRIEVGKWADFAVVEVSPESVDPARDDTRSRGRRGRRGHGRWGRRDIQSSWRLKISEDNPP